jgi:large subunit ribosomal protein L13
MFTQRTPVLKNGEYKRKWHLVDAKGKIVGRLASEVASLLKGKHNPKYTPHEDSGDHVVIVNAEKVVLTGKKWQDKEYFWHTNHIGGIKKRSATEQLQKHPELIVFEAIKGMLPKSTLGRKQLTKLRVYTGDKHEQTAQKPEALDIKTRI